MNKIIAREVPPEQINFSDYFDDDGFTEASGENCAVYIISGRNSGFNFKEYKEIQNQAESIQDGFHDVSNKWTNGYNGYTTYKECMEFNSISYNSKKCSLFKKWAENADISNIDDIAEYLTLTTGEKWNTQSFTGYSQGDYCSVLYCESKYSEECIKEIGNMWLGCGTEFSIDDTYGYYVLDTIRWTEDKRLVKTLADMYGCKPDELEVRLYTGEHRVADYKTLSM